mgnify:CR=1 FL=1
MLELLCGLYQRPFGWGKRLQPKFDFDIENMEMKDDYFNWRR